MKKFILDPKTIELFPEIQINVMTLHGIDNHVNEKDDPYFQKLLDEGTAAAEQFITVEPFRDNPVVAEWRKHFASLKPRREPARRLKLS